MKTFRTSKLALSLRSLVCFGSKGHCFFFFFLVVFDNIFVREGDELSNMRPSGCTVRSCCHSVKPLPTLSVADPGFPRGGGANSPGGHQHTILPKFPKNCMKLKEFGPGGARPKFYYVDPPLSVYTL